ncbi:tetratricopeptide repeat protein [Candidatus Micrarchaeota archaeon]|nr:tetratricopeptide repeat protein [Candidatus Micrarchaeota archaeon]
MDEIKKAEDLLNQKKYRQAADILDIIIAKGGGDRAFYLKGVTALKLKNYDLAQEYFLKAIKLSDRAEYRQVKGMSHFEVFQLEEALEEFKKAIDLDKRDVTPYFFIAMSYMFLDDPRGEEYLKTAKKMDGKKTRQLLKNFYATFIKDDPKASQGVKKKIIDMISGI